MPPRKPKEKSEAVLPLSAVSEISSASVPAPRRERRAAPATFVFGALFVVALGLAGYFYYQYSHTKEVMEAKEITELTEKIGNVMDLPEGEVPTLATVTNKEKLDDQAFFKKAENGDKILIYVDAGRAILYRPSMGQIIDTASGITVTDGPVDETSQEITSSPVPEVPEPTLVPETVQSLAPAPESVVDPLTLSATVVLYNGSKKVGVTNETETTLVGTFENLSIISREKAAKNDYTGNMVIDLSGQKTALVEALVEEIGGTIVPTVPAGETAPTDADILVIIGNK